MVESKNLSINFSDVKKAEQFQCYLEAKLWTFLTYRKYIAVIRTAKCHLLSVHHARREDVTREVVLEHPGMQTTGDIVENGHLVQPLTLVAPHPHEHLQLLDLPAAFLHHHHAHHVLGHRFHDLILAVQQWRDLGD